MPLPSDDVLQFKDLMTRVFDNLPEGRWCFMLKSTCSLWAQILGRCHPFTETSLHPAVAAGHLATWQWAVQRGYPVTFQCCRRLVAKGHLDLLMWKSSRATNENGYAFGSSQEEDCVLCDDAALSGHLEVLKWLKAQGCSWRSSVCDLAANRGHLEVLQWAFREGCDWKKDICTKAAEGGHLKVLSWLVEQNCPLTCDVAKNAALRGNVKMLHWVLEYEKEHQKESSLSEELLAFAAQGGHIAVVKWLRKQRCPWDSNACASAVVGKRFGMLKWLRTPQTQGAEVCPWDASVTYMAATRGRRKELQWAVCHGCPYWSNAMSQLGYLTDVQRWEAQGPRGVE